MPNLSQVKPVLILLLRIVAWLPLPVLHVFGALLGLVSLMRSRHRQGIAENLRQAGLYTPGLLLRTAMELGKGLLELPAIWLLPLHRVTGLVREVRGWEHVEAARHAGKGVIVLGPHLGCLELAGLYLAERLPITALYRRPRQAWVHNLMQAGRNRGLAKMVEPNLGGVRALVTALKRNEAAWVLPDQNANQGEGEWAPMFGRWAYMPTLLYRLAGKTGAKPLLFYCKRLGWGRGYRLVIEPLPDFPAETEAAMRLVNHALEESVRSLPEQYLWNYRLHRTKSNQSPPSSPAR